MRCGGNLWSRPCRGRKATDRPAIVPTVSTSLGGPNGVSRLISRASSRNSYNPDPPMTPMLAVLAIPAAERPALANSALACPLTADQATFEPVPDPARAGPFAADRLIIRRLAKTPV